MVSPLYIPLVAVSMIPIMVIGLPIARAYARRLEHKPMGTAVSPEVAARLERMEQSIDSIALEVERISEGQRFTTKLLAERAGANGANALPESSQDARTSPPHNLR
ncbi:MAG: hypothetical protein ABJE47_15250 [bacterium]